MFMNPSRFPYLDKVAQSLSTIKSELDSALDKPEIREALLSGESMDFPSNQWAWENGINRESVGYDLREGGFSMLALYKKKDDDTIINRLDLFPKTMTIISEIENYHYVAISALRPGAHIRPHTHSRSQYVYHLLLNELQNGCCEMLCGEEKRILQYPGDTVLFNYSLRHETFNHSSSVRLNLMIDFLPKEPF